jgi:hypothetical protein
MSNCVCGIASVSSLIPSIHAHHPPSITNHHSSSAGRLVGIEEVLQARNGAWLAWLKELWRDRVEGMKTGPADMLRTIVVALSVLLVLPSAAQDMSAIDSDLPAASITDGWGRGGGFRGAAAGRRPGSLDGHDDDLPAVSITDGWGHGGRSRADSRGQTPGSLGGHTRARVSSDARAGGHAQGKMLAETTHAAKPPPLDTMWGQEERPKQSTIDSQVAHVLQRAVKQGPHQDAGVQDKDVRGRQGSISFAQHGKGRGGQDKPTSEEKTTDATTYIIYRNGRVYMSEKPLARKSVPAAETHEEKMMGMAHAKVEAIAKRDKLFANTLNKEAKQLEAAGVTAEGAALEREAKDLLSKVRKMIDNKHRAEKNKAIIDRSVAEVCGMRGCGNAMMRSYGERRTCVEGVAYRWRCKV